MDDDFLLPPSSSPIPSSPGSSSSSLPPINRPGTLTKASTRLDQNTFPPSRAELSTVTHGDAAATQTASDPYFPDSESSLFHPSVSHSDEEEPRTTIPSVGAERFEEFSGGYSDDDDEQEKTADLLMRMFDRYATGQGGCGKINHESEHQDHMESTDAANHFPLSATYSTDPYLISPASGLTKIGLEAEGFPKPENHARRRFMNAQDIEDIVHGRQADGVIRNICLHTETQYDVKPSVTWDTDSVFVYPSSLGAIKTDIRVVMARQIRFNIDSDVHLQHNVTFSDDSGRVRSQAVQLQHIPHLYIGSINAYKNGTLLLFFPSLFTEANKSSWLTEEQAKLFFGEVLWPACKAVLPDSSIQHYPPGPVVADLKAGAKSREHQTQQYTRGLKEHRDYPVHSELLPALETEIQSRIRQSPQARGWFKDMFILLNVKNLKIDLRSDVSLYHSICMFEELLDKTFDVARCRIYCDPAVEICPPQPRDSYRPASNDDTLDGDGEDPVLLLWKTCCLQWELEYLRHVAFRGKQGSTRLWHSGFLRDVASLNVTPPKTSWVFRGGLRYCQWYSPQKEILDAQKNYPFDHSDLWKLAIDEHVSRTDKSVHLRPSLEKHYGGSKHRIVHSFEEYSDISFGLRFESRITYEVALLMKDMLFRSETPAPRALKTPEMAWSIAAEVHRQFMVGNFNKFSSLVECVVLSSPRSGISRARSQLIYALIQCLQQFASAHLQSQTLLWITSREVDNKVLHGLGFDQSVPTSGFGWWQDLFDWNTWSLKSDVEGELFGLRRILWACYADDLRLSTDTYALAQVCIDHAKNRYHAGDETQVKRSLTALAHFVLREYRRDVLDLLAKHGSRNRKELRQEFSTDQLKEQVRFCYEGFKEVLVGEVHLVKGSRTKCKEPAELFEWIFGHSPKYARGHFAGGAGFKKNYRVLLDKVQEATRHPPKLSKEWTERLAKEFFRYHWVIPYPDGNGTLISVSDKGGHRSFWAGRPDKTNHRWIWAAGNPHPGYPPAFPSTLSMDVAALEAHLAEEPPIARITRPLAVRPRPDDSQIMQLGSGRPRG